MATESTIKDPAEAQEMLAAMAESLGREVHIYICSAALAASTHDIPQSSKEEEPDDFYNLTAEDYAILMANKKEDIFLKTKKVRDAEAAMRRSRMTKAIIRVQFPDNYILEVKFQPSDTISQLIDLLKKAVSKPHLPFYLYITPPKQRLKDLQMDFYSAGLTPGALVYFSYELPKGATEKEVEDINEGPFLRNELMALKDLHLLLPFGNIGMEMQQSEEKPASPPVAAAEAAHTKPKKTGSKPKWLKL